MRVVLALARVDMRRRMSAILGLGVALALGLGVAIASLEAAARTSNAYSSYLRRAGVAELVVNPSLNTDRAESIIASTPGLDSYTSDSLLTATTDRGEPRPQAEVESDSTQVRVSGDGRYSKSDRPVIRRGRMIRRGSEAFVNAEMAEALRIDVGDMLPLAFWHNNTSAELPSGLVYPIGRVEVRVVGVGVFADEVLADGLYPRYRVLVTPEVGSPFDCTAVQPDPKDTRTLDELGVVLFPPTCAATYRYFSLRVHGGDAAVGPLRDALAARFAEETQRLPGAIRAKDIGFEITPTVTAEDGRRVRRALAPAVRSLALFGGAATVATLVVVMLGALRSARREEAQASTWRDLGASHVVRAAALSVPLAVAAALGLAGSAVVGWLASGIGPVASARVIEPAGRLGLSAQVMSVVLGFSGAVLIVGVGFAAGFTARPSRPRAAQAPGRLVGARIWTTGASVPLGVRAASLGAGSRALLAASVAAVSAVVATVVFSSSLDALVSNPARFGWPYDVAATLNFGYGGNTDPAAIAATLDRPEVERWGLASVSNVVSVNGQTVAAVAALGGFDAFHLPLLEGESPVASDEIALGVTTARQLNLGVGDTAMVSTLYGDRKARVRGLVVMPPVGAFGADRASLGTGVMLSAPLFENLLRESEKDRGLEPGQLVDSSAGFVGVDLRPGVDRKRFVAAISGGLTSWDPSSGSRPFVYIEPVRPPAVANVATMRSVPMALAGLLGMAMAVGLTVAIGLATRVRRRELAVLRALGCIGRQLRSTVRAQALAVVAVGLVVGIPLGIAAGRVAYQAFATGLGVLPEPAVPATWILAVIVVAVGVGLVAAAGPGHRAARVRASEALYQE